MVLKSLSNADFILARVAGDRPDSGTWPRPRLITCAEEGGANCYDALGCATHSAEKVCPNVAIEKTIKEAFAFANSSSGLNMSSRDSSIFAAEQAKKIVFACGERFQ